MRGIRYRLVSTFPGRPDLVFPGADLRSSSIDALARLPEHGVMPRNNAPFWAKKIARTKEHDAAVERELSAARWEVVRLWDHKVRASTAHAAEMVSIAVTSSRHSLKLKLRSAVRPA